MRLAVAALLLVACAEPNAILDVSMSLPVLEGRSIAFVQVGTALDRFEDEWGSEPIVFDLESSEGGCNIEFSVEASRPRSDAEVLESVRIKVWFCDARAPTCSEELGGPTWQISLERPLYPGQRTEWILGPEGSLDCSPLTSGSRLPQELSSGLSLEVDRCQIRGCVEGEAAAGRDFCLDSTRIEHACD